MEPRHTSAQPVEPVSPMPAIDQGDMPEHAAPEPTTQALLPSIVPALTVLALRFAAGEGNPIEYVLTSAYGSGGH